MLHADQNIFLRYVEVRELQQGLRGSPGPHQAYAGDAHPASAARHACGTWRVPPCPGL
jgi:hypothetical protein